MKTLISDLLSTPSLALANKAGETGLTVEQIAAHVVIHWAGINPSAILTSRALREDALDRVSVLTEIAGESPEALRGRIMDAILTDDSVFA